MKIFTFRSRRNRFIFKSKNIRRRHTAFIVEAENVFYRRVRRLCRVIGKLHRGNKSAAILAASRRKFVDTGKRRLTAAGNHVSPNAPAVYR